MLRIELEAFSGEKLTLDYANFSIGAESDSYRMKVGNYLGNNLRYSGFRNLVYPTSYSSSV